MLETKFGCVVVVGVVALMLLALVTGCDSAATSPVPPLTPVPVVTPTYAQTYEDMAKAHHVGLVNKIVRVKGLMSGSSGGAAPWKVALRDAVTELMLFAGAPNLPEVPPNGWQDFHDAILGASEHAYWAGDSLMQWFDENDDMSLLDQYTLDYEDLTLDNMTLLDHYAIDLETAVLILDLLPAMVPER